MGGGRDIIGSVHKDKLSLLSTSGAMGLGLERQGGGEGVRKVLETGKRVGGVREILIS